MRTANSTLALWLQSSRLAGWVAEPLGAMRIFHQLVWLLLCGLTVLTVGCDYSPSDFTQSVAEICPHGWQVATSSNVITLRREVPVWIMGKVAHPARGPNESIEDYFKSAGREIHYELRLRFVPLVSEAEYRRLRTAREEAAASFNKGASGKSEYTQWQKHYEQCQVPAFFTRHYSIFLDRWADRGVIIGHRVEPRFIDVYPPDAISEIEAVIKKLGRVFNEYPGSVTE